MIRPGGAEIIVVLLVVILLFGGGRIAKIAKEFGTGIRLFREAVNGKESGEDKVSKNSGL